MREFFLSINVYLYIVPVTIAISLVYAASRYEDWGPLLKAAGRLAGMIFGLLAAAMVVMLAINW